jgi:hypothetical protein
MHAPWKDRTLRGISGVLATTAAAASLAGQNCSPA